MKRVDAADETLRPVAKPASKGMRPLRAGREPGESHTPIPHAPSPRLSSPTREAVSSAERPRSALKIRLDILESVRDDGPSSSSKIICMANLSVKRSAKYLGELVMGGLLREDRDGAAKTYTLTVEGLDFVNQVKEAEAFAADLGLAL